MRHSLVAFGLLPILASAALVDAHADEGGGLIGSDAPAGKRYVYKHSAGGPREMEVFFPPNHDPAKSRAPGLILFHGGNWVGGSLAQFRIACAYFASRGLVCATAEYQMLSKEEAAKLPPGETRKRVCVTDAKSAIRWVRSHADEWGIDPTKIIAAGGSAGGHLAACTALAVISEPSVGTMMHLYMDFSYRCSPKAGFWRTASVHPHGGLVLR